MTLARIHKTTRLKKAVVLKWKVRASLRVYIMWKEEDFHSTSIFNIEQTKHMTVVQVGLVLRWGGYDAGLR